MSGKTRDIKDFEFQQLCKIRLFKPPDTVSKQRAELLASASKYGLCFAGFEKNLLVFKTAEVFRIDEEKRMERKSQTIAENFPVLKNLTFASEIVHIAVSCNELILLVVLDSSQLLFFDTRAFYLPDVSRPYLVHKIEAGSSVTDLAWNPATPELLAVCLSTGVVKMFHVSSDVKLDASLQIEATCLCWSPKGKQVVIGTQQGELKQYAQNLEIKKKWPCPNNLEFQVKVVDVVWVSTFMFIAAYQSPNASDKQIVQIVKVPKDAQPSFINFRDPCYGFGEERQAKYFFHLLLKWEMVVMASSNSLEAAIVAKNLDTADSWEHWMLEDSARAEVPITEDKSDSFPLGVTIDYSSPKQIIVNENESIGPFPLLLILSTDGVLVSFHMVYKHKGAVPLTNQVENLPTMDIRKSLPDFVISNGPLIVPCDQSSSSTAVPQGQTQGQAHFPALQFDAKVVTPTVTPATTSQTSGLAPGSSAPFTFGSSAPSIIYGGQVPAATAPQSLGHQSSPFTFTGPPLMTKPADASAAPITLAAPKTGFNFSPLPAPTTSAATAESKNIFGTASQSQVNFNFTGSSSQNPPASLPTTQVASTSQAFSFNFASKPFASLNSGPAALTTSTTPSATVPHAVPTTASTKPATFATPSLSASNFQSSQTPFSASITATAFTNQGIMSTNGTSSTNLSFAKSVPSLVTKPAEATNTIGVNKTKPSVPVLAPSAPSSSPAVAKPPPPFQVKPITVNQKPTKRNESGGHVITSEVPSQLVDLKQQTAINETVDITFGKSIIEEINHFTRELRDLKTRFLLTKEIVGTDAEKKDLKIKTEKMTAFSNDVQQTTTIQQKEITEQKFLLFDLFKMLEECRTMNERNHDIQYHKLLRAQSLDPASAETMNKLHQMQQTVSNGLYDANVVLDQQWEDFQNKSNKKGRKLQPSGVDTVYKVVKKNQSIINGQKLIVKSISTQLKDLHLYKKNSWSYGNIPTIKPGYTPSVFSENELSSLANTLIAEEQKQSSEVISPKVVTISPLKQTMLREHLTKRSVKIVKAESPGNEVSRLSSKDFPKFSLDKEMPAVKESPGNEVSRLSSKDFSKFCLDKEMPAVKESPAVNVPESQYWESRSGPELMPGVKQALSFNSGLSTSDIGTGFFSSGHQTSLETSTPLKSVEKPASKEGVFPLSTTTPTPTNYASGLKLDDVTPTYSENGEEEDVGTNAGEEWYPEGCEDYEEEEEEDDEEGEEEEEEEEEEEYAHPVEKEEGEEIIREIPFVQGPVPPVVSTAPAFEFTNTKPVTFSFNNSTNTGFSTPASTMPLLSSNMPSSPHVSTTPLTKTNLFSTVAASTFSPQTVFNQAATDSSATQFDVPAASTRLGLLATPTPVASSGVSKNLFTSTSASTTSFNFSESSSKSVEPFAQVSSLSSQTQPTVSSSITDKPASVITSPQSETTTMVSIPVSSLSQTATITPTTATTTTTTTATTTTSTSAVVTAASTVATTEASKPNVTFSFASQSNLDQTSQATTSPFSSQFMFKAPTSNLTAGFGSSAMPSSGLFQSSSTAAASSSSPAAGLFTLPSSSSTASGTLFKSPVTTTAPVAVTIAATTLATASTSSTSFSFSLINKPSIATGTAVPSSTIVSAPDPSPTVTTTSTSTLGSLLSSPVPAKSEGLLQSLTGSSSTTGAAEAAAAAVIATAAATAAVSPTPATTGIFSPSSTGPSTVFGQPSSSSSTSPITELFKQSPVTTSAGLFGKSTSTSSSDLFGKSSPAQGLFSQPFAGGTSIFGQATASSGNSIVSGTSGTISGPIFGNAKIVFGNAPTGTLFGATPSSTVTQPAVTSSSPFGQSSISGFGQATSTTAFGKATFGQSAFGQSSDTFKTSSPFGQSGASSSVFGQASSSSVFGQSSSSTGGSVSSVFGNASTTSSSTPAAAAAASATSSSGSGGLFGSSSPFFSGLGGKPSQENVDKNVFGSTNQVFGQSSSQNAATLFGNQSPNSGFKSVPLSSPKLSTSFGFGSTAGGTTGTSSTTSAGSSVAATGFGVGQQQSQQQQSQSPGVFGGSPSFGSSASFGGAPAFGNKSAFGFGSSTFGSNVPAFSSPFGGAQASSVFGQTATSSQASNSSGFANFAQSSSPTFGSLAQTSPGFGQQQQQQQQQQNTNTAFGGSSFGSSVPSFGSNSGGGSFGSGSAFGQSASFTGYRS